MRLVEELEYKIGREISNLYWDCPSDHADYDKILNALNDQISVSEIVHVIQGLYKAGFRIVKI